MCFFFLMIRRPPRSTLDRSSAASDVYKRQGINAEYMGFKERKRRQMVQLIYKKTDQNQFLYSTTVLTPVEQVIRELVTINNLRIKLDRLCIAMEELAQKGPLKPEELRGLSNYEQYGDDLTVKQGLEKMPPKVGAKQVEEKTNYRTGWVLDDEVVAMILKHVGEAKAVIHKDQVAKKVALTEKMLLDQIDILRGVIMIAYPGYHGVGVWEPARVILETKDLEAFYNPDDVDFIEESTATLWYAGKELLRGKKLYDFLGKNEKTTVVVKITKSGTGAPVREPLIDQETHKKMLAYYYKKQEEAKKLDKDGEDAYLESPWANPKGLKNELHGVQDVKWKFKQPISYSH
eukprot:TRINITY_DN4531_c0_g2_i1.p1 TRINITY_DN4531_c0_g2~~TRINITY_DN4531_c0_g2_i1.p1  ORF type:complete len:347 (+),score=82.46 TRINITY_DN4531_c0_g2_i1:2-1042(+)